MKRNLIASLLFLLCSATVFSQAQDNDVLLTIDDETISVKEFERVYLKNLDLVQDVSKKDKEAYLELFIDYKLKTKEAYTQGLHKKEKFEKEYQAHRDELSKKYINDQEITDDLIDEAYERLQEEVKVSHILITVKSNATPEDTLAAYNKIKDVHKKATSGEDFETLAKTYSQEPNAKQSGGSLGFFKGFTMVYPFESQAYKTPVGEVSKVFRTRFGYHILKVHEKRKAPQDVTVAHIMVATKGDVTEEAAEKKIHEIYQRLQQGEDFKTLAKQLSDDAPSAKKGGELQRLSPGKINSKTFEETAFYLEKPGDISEPVQTKFGWHIIQLKERHPRKPKEDMREELLRKLKNSDRSTVIDTKVTQKIKKQHNYKEENDPTPFFTTFVTKDVLSAKWEYSKDTPELDKKVFTIGDKSYTFDDFAAYIKNNQKQQSKKKEIAAVVSEMYTNFKEKMVLDFYMDTLEEENEEFAAILAEYRDGLLIYEVMQENVWEPIKEDSTGLVAYYEKNKANYTNPKRIKATIVSASNKKSAKKAQKLFRDNKDSQEVEKALNKKDNIQVSTTSGTFELGHHALPENLKAKEGVSKIYKTKDPENTKNKNFVVLHIEKVYPEAVRKLEDIRGMVMSDFQDEQEKKWMQKLRKKYKVKVNKEALN